MRFACINLKVPHALHTVITLINRCQNPYSITELWQWVYPASCDCAWLSVCVQNTGPYLKQGHVFAVILLALLRGGITAVDEGAALLGVTVTWKKHTHTSTFRLEQPDMSFSLRQNNPLFLCRLQLSRTDQLHSFVNLLLCFSQERHADRKLKPEDVCQERRGGLSSPQSAHSQKCWETEP